MNIFEGKTSKISGNEVREITLNGNKLISDHSIEHGCSFSWGHHGHGSRYLAEALLIKLGYGDEFASKNMTRISEQLISVLPENWSFTSSELKVKIDDIAMN